MIKGTEIQVEEIDNKITSDNKIYFLDDILKKITNNDLLINVEIKVYNLSIDRVKLLCDNLISSLKKYNLNFLLSSFNKNVIKYLLKKKNYKIGMIFENKIDDSCMSIIPKLDYIIAEKNFTSLINEYKNKNLIFYTLKDSVYDKEFINKYKSNNNIGLISDNVYELIKYLDY